MRWMWEQDSVLCICKILVSVFILLVALLNIWKECSSKKSRLEKCFSSVTPKLPLASCGVITLTEPFTQTLIYLKCWVSVPVIVCGLCIHSMTESTLYCLGRGQQREKRRKIIISQFLQFLDFTSGEWGWGSPSRECPATSNLRIAGADLFNPFRFQSYHFIIIVKEMYSFT